MPVIYNKTYNPSGFWRNGHFNSVLSNRFRNIIFDFEKERMDTKDGDFVELGWRKQGADKLLILIHGLEGSMESTYIKGLSKAMFDNGFDICAMSLRGCSGQLEQLQTFYHSGFTTDLEQVVEEKGFSYESVSIGGFSLGGNMLLKYLGSQEIMRPKNVKSAMAISVPTRLAESCAHLDKTIYRHLFIKSLKEKGYAYDRIHPGLIDLKRLNKIKSLYDFDDTVTAPAHGFLDAQDYYDQSSSAQYIPLITTSTMIINSLDDPFFPRQYNPVLEADQNENVRLVLTKYGGHVGFYMPSNKSTFVEDAARDFLCPK